MTSGDSELQTMIDKLKPEELAALRALAQMSEEERQEALRELNLDEPNLLDDLRNPRWWLSVFVYLVVLIILLITAYHLLGGK